MGIDETDERALLLRRRALLTLGALGTGTLLYGSRAARRAAGELLSVRSASAQSPCLLTPEQTEGPYYLEDEPFRRTISEGRPGTPLLLLLKVQDTATCAPIPDAVVEIWHADADGSYSGFDGATNGTYMRGQQVTNRVGRVRFRTIYPGWYRGRTTHVHVKVHAGGDVVHTGQLYFDDAVTDVVYGRQPYSARGMRDTDNASDGIFANGGTQSLLGLSPRGRGHQGKLTLGVRAGP
jgi:protocatechuate 3,4-dioxygenase beta subunit